MSTLQVRSVQICPVLSSHLGMAINCFHAYRSKSLSIPFPQPALPLSLRPTPRTPNFSRRSFHSTSRSTLSLTPLIPPHHSDPPRAPRVTSGRLIRANVSHWLLEIKDENSKRWENHEELHRQDPAKKQSKETGEQRKSVKSKGVRIGNALAVAWHRGNCSPPLTYIGTL